MVLAYSNHCYMYISCLTGNFMYEHHVEKEV